VRRLVLLVALAGCLEPAQSRCGALVCAADAVCIEGTRCASRAAVTACDQAADGTACSTPSFTGVCANGACWFDDADGDFVPDAQDICPTAANADQLDTDSDGRGDVCDGCPLDAKDDNHDEDGDGFGDSCDVCPAFPDFQVDIDGDGVGAACDRGGLNRRLFDPFLTLDPAWVPSQTTPWLLLGDAIEPMTTLPPTDLGLTRPSLVLSTSRLSTVVNIQSQRGWKSGDVVVQDLRDPVTDVTHARCQIRCGDNGCVVLGEYDGNPTNIVVVTPSPSLRFEVSVDTAMHFMRCIVSQIGGEQFSYTALAFNTFDVTPAIISQPELELTAFEAYDK
jgi:hypothetical protein